MYSNKEELEAFVDRKSYLTQEDVNFLRQRLRKQLRSFTMWLIIFSVFSLLINKPSMNDLYAVLTFWVFISVIMWYHSMRRIDTNEKLITRGLISARWGRGEDDGHGTKRSDRSFFLQIHGKVIRVDRQVYEQYHRRDFVEFHYLADETVLSHVLLKRE